MELSGALYDLLLLARPYSLVQIIECAKPAPFYTTHISVLEHTKQTLHQFFLDQYEWKERNFSSKPKKRKKFENNNEAVALNVLFSPSNIEEIKQVYIPKHNSERKGKVFILK